MQYSTAVFDALATDLEKLNAAKPPALSADSGSLQEYTINLALKPLKDTHWRIFGSVVVTRSVAARAAYRAGAAYLEEYIQALPKNHRLEAFQKAKAAFEQCVHDARIAVDTVRHMEAKAIGTKSPKGLVYVEDDGSIEDRLAKMDNRTKHFAEDILSGKISHPAPLWITNDGLACSKCVLSFAELAQLLEELGENLTFTARDIFSLKSK